MKKNKKGQFFLLAGFILLTIITFIYSLETENAYILYPSENQLVNNIIFESCKVGNLSNGSLVDSRFSNFSSDVVTYCSSLGINCTLTITSLTPLPSNLSNWSYLNYSYNIDYAAGDYSYESDFNC